MLLRVLPRRQTPALFWTTLFALTLVSSHQALASQQALAQAYRPLERPDEPPARLQSRRTSPAARPRVASFVSIQVNVAPDGSNIVGDAANEPSIAVDPLQPNRMAIGWRQFDSIASNFREAGYAYSSDGGRTWTFPGVLTPNTFRSDPVLASDAAGNFYYNSLQVVNNNFTCDVFISSNGGRSWSGPFAARGGDKAWMTVDRSGGMGHGHLYSSWSTAAGCCGSNIFTRSTDGGTFWDVPVSIPLSPIWGTMDVGPDGTLWIGGVEGANTSSFAVVSSASAQNPFSVPIFESTSRVNMGGSIGLQLAPNPAGLLGQVSIAVDPSSGPTAGWLYMLCSVDPSGNDPMDVHFVRSTDGGQTWSTPVRINDAQSGYQWFGTMSVAPNGRIDVIWNDTRNTGVPNESALYYSSSSDGGTTWTPNVQLSQVWDSYLGWPDQFKIGDYYHMVSDDVGAHLAWAATFNGEQDVYYLRIGDYDCNVNGVGDSLDIASGTSHDWNGNGIPDDCENITVSDVSTPPGVWQLHQNVPNPFNPATTITFTAPTDARDVRLTVHDVAGRAVRTLVDGPARSSRQSVVWDGRDYLGREVPTGLYLYRLQAADFTSTRKMLLIR